MIHAEHRYHLDVSPERAFEYLAHPGRDAEWQASCLASRLLDDEPRVGGRYDIEFSFMGRRARFVGRITERTPPAEYAFEVVEGPFLYHGRYSFRPAEAGGGVDVHWQFWAQPARFFGILPASLLRKVLVSQVESDVAKLRKRFATEAT